jgi:hypothetical protein
MKNFLGSCARRLRIIPPPKKRTFLRHFLCYDGNGDAFTGSEVIAILYKRYPVSRPFTTDVLTDEQIYNVPRKLDR